MFPSKKCCSPSDKAFTLYLAYFIIYSSANNNTVDSNPAQEPLVKQFRYEPIKTTWPLQEDYPNSRINNLNSYLSLFSECLLNVQNFQGIDLDEWAHPLFITRFDIAGIIQTDLNTNQSFLSTFQYLYDKVPSLEALNDESYEFPDPEYIKSTDTIKFRWRCFAKFDIFLPERKEAMHFYHYHSRRLNEDSNILGPSAGLYWEGDCK